jgi:predicted nuclease with TOPRIM domain
VRDGVCRFPKEALVGDIGVTIITNQGVIPCTSLVAGETKSGVMVFPDARDVLERLDRAERDISECLEIIERLEGKYDDLDNRLKRLFVGYEM